MKRTFQPSVLKRKRTHGFRARMATKGGRKVIARRRARGRRQLSAWELMSCCRAWLKLTLAKTLQTVSQSFPRQSRLLSKKDFSQVFDCNTKRASNRYALLLALPSEQSHSRIGLVIAKKNVKLAVERNRIKRLVREHFRCHPLSSPYDLVFLARRNLHELSNHDIRSQLHGLWKKLEPNAGAATPWIESLSILT